ncbi:MAG: AAA family ATPase [Bacteroidales bacterium]|nr:AAA family ATPase [Bacteroidales bacterium]
MMFFGKYQQGDLSQGQMASNAKDSNGNSYRIRWIRDLEENGEQTYGIRDRLGRLQKVECENVAKIIDHDYVGSQKAYAVVQEVREYAYTLKQLIEDEMLNEELVVRGFRDIAKALEKIHRECGIGHCGISEDTIIVDPTNEDSFKLIDFGVFDNPEKEAFPWQHDILELGNTMKKCIDVLRVGMDGYRLVEITEFVDKMTSSDVSERPAWRYVIGFFDEYISKLCGQDENECEKYVEITFTNKAKDSIGEDYNKALSSLENDTVYFVNVRKDMKNGREELWMDVMAGEFYFKWVKWEEKQLLFTNEIKRDKGKVENSKRIAHKLPGCYRFSECQRRTVDISSFLEQWAEEDKGKGEYRKELGFYKKLLEKEKEVIAKKSLHLRYDKYEINGYDITFEGELNDKCSPIGQIRAHVDEGNDPNSEGFKYVISAIGGNKKDGKVEFTGKPYIIETIPPDDEDEVSVKKTDKTEVKRRFILKIKDCEGLKKDEIPQKGQLKEDTRQEEEEKQRQLDAIRKVETGDVANKDLIYYLFKPGEMQFDYGRTFDMKEVFQKDDSGQPFEYSFNQRKAICNALSCRPLSVIQGPPGTGKTTVITEIVFQILNADPKAKILITSQTNNAVDQVLENLLKNEIPVLRLCGVTPPKMESIKEHTINRKFSGWKKQVADKAKSNFSKEIEVYKEKWSAKSPFAEVIMDKLIQNPEWKDAKSEIETVASRTPQLKVLQNLPMEEVEAIKAIEKTLGIETEEFRNKLKLHRDWLSAVSSLDEKSPINMRLIDSIRVVGATCNHIASKKYSRYNFDGFDYVIMDESGKATMAESLVPIVRGKNLVFVGDHRQLRSMLTASRDVEKWLREEYKKEGEDYDGWDDYVNRPSLFERVITKIPVDFKSQLTECRRMSEDQVELTSMCFYEPEGDQKIKPVKRDSEKEHNLPLAIKSSVFFIDTGSDKSNRKDDNGSSFNNDNVEVIGTLLQKLNDNGGERIKDYTTGLITGYTAQYRRLRKKVGGLISKNKLENMARWANTGDKKKRGEKLTTSVIDRFQGLERDIMIVDLVKSGANLDLGFLETPNRINVGLSRQKRLLFIVGDYNGIVNARPKHSGKGKKKVALQMYLMSLKEMNEKCIISSDDLDYLFPRRKKPEFIPTEHPKLEGPKVLGKIELKK